AEPPARRAPQPELNCPPCTASIQESALQGMDYALPTLIRSSHALRSTAGHAVRPERLLAGRAGVSQPGSVDSVVVERLPEHERFAAQPLRCAAGRTPAMALCRTTATLPPVDRVTAADERLA